MDKQPRIMTYRDLSEENYLDMDKQPRIRKDRDLSEGF
jgi:hypothetical protein